jgi:hypothetical protein
VFFLEIFTLKIATSDKGPWGPSLLQKDGYKKKEAALLIPLH